MGSNPRTTELLDIVDSVLRETQEPVHYKELTQVLVESGLWANPWGKEPDQILYSALHNDVKRCGPVSGRFLFFGGGVFSTSFVEGIEQLEEHLPVPSTHVSERDRHARPGDMPGEADRRREQAEAIDANRRCGNCTHLYWDGPNLHTHECGGCAAYDRSRRATVYRTSKPCEFWKRRTAAQFNADRETPVKLLLEAEHIRVTGTRFDAAKARGKR